VEEVPVVEVLVAVVEALVLVEVLVLGVLEVLDEVVVVVVVGVVVFVAVLALGVLGVVDGQVAVASAATRLAPSATAELRVGSIPPRLAAEFVSVVAA
jgi:hypothetical protein